MSPSVSYNTLVLKLFILTGSDYTGSLIYIKGALGEDWDLHFQVFRISNKSPSLCCSLLSWHSLSLYLDSPLPRKIPPVLPTLLLLLYIFTSLLLLATFQHYPLFVRACTVSFSLELLLPLSDLHLGAHIVTETFYLSSEVCYGFCYFPTLWDELYMYVNYPPKRIFSYNYWRSIC